MDTVSLDFSERVSAMRKCCDRMIRLCKCVPPALSSRKWTFPTITRIALCIDDDRGREWKYGFKIRVSDYVTFSMDELLKRPDLKSVQIAVISINNGTFMTTFRMKPLNEVVMEKLLYFTSFLANEPELLLGNFCNEFQSPEQLMLFKWLEERWFSRLGFGFYQHSVHNRLLQKQFSRRCPTQFSFSVKLAVEFLFSDKLDVEFLADQLRSGRMTCCYAHDAVFSCDVMEGIIQNFLRCPSKKKVNISAYFEKSVYGHLMKMQNEMLRGDDAGKFIFKSSIHKYEYRDFIKNCIHKREIRKFIFENSIHKLEVSLSTSSWLQDCRDCSIYSRDK